jgi:hypothetical protein
VEVGIALIYRGNRWLRVIDMAQCNGENLSMGASGFKDYYGKFPNLTTFQ